MIIMIMQILILATAFERILVGPDPEDLGTAEDLLCLVCCCSALKTNGQWADSTGGRAPRKRCSGFSIFI